MATFAFGGIEMLRARSVQGAWVACRADTSRRSMGSRLDSWPLKGLSSCRTPESGSQILRHSSSYRMGSSPQETHEALANHGLVKSHLSRDGWFCLRAGHGFSISFMEMEIAVVPSTYSRPSGPSNTRTFPVVISKPLRAWSRRTDSFLLVTA
ncbi:hypothetical protein BO71DRAFT_488736 [Aspergillus ellipticus CBS 707.79]|uniref:Uncharacterized protein n=1 Tax=Aspergillus ellipticus CBS 707.79 TaxID=1448320 RepID=A0A319CVF7_9EURO|nr:hypothetical protein BO71DRAFT_488736 [Aspergillus ellipticus CBS 707.79]